MAAAAARVATRCGPCDDAAIRPARAGLAAHDARRRRGAGAGAGVVPGPAPARWVPLPRPRAAAAPVPAGWVPLPAPRGAAAPAPAGWLPLPLPAPRGFPPGRALPFVRPPGRALPRFVRPPPVTAPPVVTPPVTPPHEQQRRAIPFVAQLKRMIEERPEIIRWRRGDIVIPDPAALERNLSKYYKHSKYASFQRQLNNFGYRRRFALVSGDAAETVYERAGASENLDDLLALRPVRPAPPAKSAGATSRPPRRNARVRVAAAPPAAFDAAASLLALGASPPPWPGYGVTLLLCSSFLELRVDGAPPSSHSGLRREGRDGLGTLRVGRGEAVALAKQSRLPRTARVRGPIRKIRGPTQSRPCRCVRSPHTPARTPTRRVAHKART